MLDKSGRVRSILARLGFEDDDDDDDASCAAGGAHHGWCATVGCHGCGERLGTVRMLGMVVLRAMVLRRERLPELGPLQMAIDRLSPWAGGGVGHTSMRAGGATQTGRPKMFACLGVVVVPLVDDAVDVVVGRVSCCFWHVVVSHLKHRF